MNVSMEERRGVIVYTVRSERPEWSDTVEVVPRPRITKVVRVEPKDKMRVQAAWASLFEEEGGR